MKQGYKEQNHGSHSLRSLPIVQAGHQWLTPRDIEIVRWVHSAGIATREQIQRLFFTNGGRSRCQHRLTLLHRSRYLDTIRRSSPNHPNIYYISRKSVNGLRLLRSIYTENTVKAHGVPQIQIQHTLDIGSCHIAFIKACNATGYSLRFWLGTDELAKHIQTAGFIPDAYFQICRTTEDGEKMSGFFLEVERSGKSEQALEKKFRLYGELYYQGLYEAQFGTKALRILFLVGSDYGINPERQIEKLMRICNKLNVTIFRFAPLKDFLTENASNILTTQIWRHPNTDKWTSLF